MALTPFSDGVEIEIAGVDAGAAADASDILGDGTVYYDATYHILTLDAAEIYGPIYIDGSAISDVVTIVVISNCLVRTTNIHAIQYVGVEGLEIIGNDDSNILTADVLGSSDGYCAILCADAPDGTNASPLTVGGIRLNASNDQLSSPLYSPIVCDRYYFDECMLSISTSAAREAITTFNLPNILEKVVLMDQSAYGQTSLVGLHYNEAFPIWVDGVQMHDGLNTNSDGFYVMSSTMNEKEYLSSIKEGGIGYDPATRTVWLYNGFELESRNLNASFALEIGDATSENFYLKAAGWPYQTHKIQGLENSPTYRGGLFLHDNLTIDINGMDVEFFSQKYPAVYLDDNDLTIVNSGDRDKMLLIQSDDDKGLDGPGNLTIDHCKVEFDAKKELCSGLTSFTLDGVKVDGTSYEKGTDGISEGLVDASTTNWAKSAVADIIPAAWFLTVNVDPKPAAGYVEAKNSSEVVLYLPYEYSADEDVTVSAIENPGWSFLQWESGSVANPRTVSLEAGYDANLTAYFVRNIESDKRFYAIAEMGEIYSIDEKLRGMPADLSLQLPIGSGNNLRRAVFAANKIFFTEENGINLSLSVIDFDGEHLGASATELLAMQDRFNPIRAMVYSESESLFYAIAHDNTATADVLISIALDGTVTPIGQLPPELDTYVRAMAINATGDLYVVIDYAGAQLYKLDKVTVAGTLIGTMPGIMGLPTYYQVNLVFDNTTDELIFSTDMPTKFYLVDPATADMDPISEVSMGFNALFQLSAAPTPKHHIEVSVATGQDTWGSVQISECSCDGGDFDEGASLTLVATPATGFDFVEWTDGNTDATRSLIVGSSDQSFIATFQAQVTKTNISVSIKSGDESKGDVEIVECSCTSGTFDEGTKLTLRANRNTIYTFDEWDDGVDDNPRVITVGDVDKEYVASFLEGDPWEIQVKVDPAHPTWGEAALPGGLTTAEYKDGAEIKIVATPAAGYEFDHWSDGTNDYTNAEQEIVVNATLVFTAYFKEAAKVEIEVAVAAGQEARGTVSLPGGKTKDEFAIGASVELTAKANDGFKFEKWDDENTSAVRTITVSGAKKFIASFVEAPVTKDYPVTIAGVTLNEEKATLIAGTDLAGILKTGFISYDPTTNTLTLNNVELEFTDDDHSLSIDGGEAKTKVNIEIVGTCKITAASVGVALSNSTMITLSGDGKLDIKATAGGIYLDNANLTLDGIALNIEATGNGIVGENKTEKLIVKGAAISVKGSGGSILALGDMELKYCSFKDHYDFANNQVEKDGALATDAVVLDVWPMLTVSPVEKGTAKFILTSKKHDDEFTDKGWFEDGDVVTIEVEAAEGFVFGHWTDDTDWKDTKKRKGDSRKFDKDDTNQTLSALMYYEAQSDADWFGVNSDEFVRFSFDNNAEKVARASNSLTDVKAGDYADEQWIFIEGSTVNKFPFSGTLNDGKDILGKDEKIEKYNKKSLSDATDMAYDLINEELFAVSGSKLYRINSTENKEIATFKLEGVETTIISIAVNADGVMYALGLGDGTEGALYTVDVDDKVAKLKPVGKKENNGKIGMKVADAAQSIAFDLKTGELFWGAADYVRVIDIAKMKTFIAGDLGQKEGAQGYIQSLHRMNVAVEVTVEVDKAQAEWGTASVGDETTTAKKTSVSATFVEGAPVTITAEANDGYHFVEWQNADSKKDTHSEASYEFEAEEVTYIAVFAEGGQGIQSITIDPTKNVQKVLIDGTIYIFRDGRVYTVTGERME